MTNLFQFGSSAWPSDPTMPTAPPEGYIAPAMQPSGAAVEPPMTEGQAQAHRDNFIEMILQQVAQALFGYSEGEGSAFEQIASWAIHLVADIAAIPGKTWDFFTEDLWGLVVNLFSGEFGTFFGTIWKWVTNFIGITGNGGILGMMGAVGQWIKGLFGSGDGEDSLTDKAVDGVKKSSIFSGIKNFFQTAWEVISGAFSLFGGGTGEDGGASSGIWNWLKNVWNTVAGWVRGGWDIVQGIFGFFGGGSGEDSDGGIRSAAKNVAETVTGFVSGASDTVQGVVQFVAGEESLLRRGWDLGKSLWDRIAGFFITVSTTIQKGWDWLTGEGSIVGQAKSMLSGLTTIKTRLGETSVGQLITDAAAIVSSPDGDDSSLTQKAYKVVWDKINCFGGVGQLFSLGQNITGFIDNPSGASFGSLVEGATGLVGADNIVSKVGATVGNTIGDVTNFIGSPKDPSDLFGGQTLASYAIGKAASFIGFGDTSNTLGGLFGTTTRVGGDFMSMLGSPTGLGTGLGNLTMGPMLPPVNLYNSFGALSPFQFGTMPAGAVAVTPVHASNLVNEGAFRAGITVADETEGWSWDDIEGRTIPGSLKVDADGVTNEMVANQIPVVAGQSLDLSAYVKWLDLAYTGSDPIAIGITGYDYEPLTKAYNELESVDVAALSAPGASGGWSQISGTYVVPDVNTPDVVRFRLKIGGNLTAGSVWFDEVEVVNTDLVSDAVVPGIGSILNNGVNGLENLAGTGWGHADFFGAMFGQNAAGIGLATRVTQLETAAAAGTSGEDLFERTSSTSLGANWSQTYTAGAGLWATSNGHDASWDSSGTSDREVLCRFIGTGATSAGDNQKTTAVLGSKAEADYFGGVAHNYLLGRVGSDMLNYILADFDGNGNISITRCLAGVRSVLGSTNVQGLSSGATIGLICGTASGARFFKALINEQAVSFSGSTEVSDATSQVGASFRGRGHGALAKGSFFNFTQLKPGKLNSWAATDL